MSGDAQSWLQAIGVGVLGAIWWELRYLRKRLHDIENWKASQLLLLDQVRRFMEKL